MEEEWEENFQEFFLVWESSCRNFIDSFTFATEEAELSKLRIHVFLRSDTPGKAMPPVENYVELHYSLTTCPFASDTTIIAYLLERFAYGNQEDSFGMSPSTVFLVTDEERKYEELIASLKLKDRQLNVVEVKGCDKTILDVIDSACKYCKLVFSNNNEAEEHLKLKHNYFCENRHCSRNRRRFYSKDELQRHISKQTVCPYCSEMMFCSNRERVHHMKTVHDITEELTSPRDNIYTCQFCPERRFHSEEQKEVHMKNNHKKCNCSCGQYFRTRDEYIDHFYSVYPLPCYENRKCPHRFQSVVYQAEHHRREHLSIHPFYCVPCQQRQTETGLKQRISFKDEKSLRIHGMSLGHNEEEMFLSAGVRDSLRLDVSGQRKAPSRTCSAINYC